MPENRQKGTHGLYCCPCCGYATLGEPSGYEICPICFWEDDGQDDPRADESWGGPNPISLSEGRMNFLLHGASDGEDKEHCRSPQNGDEQLRFFFLDNGILKERKPEPTDGGWNRTTPEDSSVDPEWILSELCWILQVLASPADVQISVYPDFVIVVDELALDIDHWSRVAVGNFGQEFTEEQKKSLADINDRLVAASRKEPGYSHILGLPESLSTSPLWEETRDLAKKSLLAFGWPIRKPGQSSAQYVLAAVDPPDNWFLRMCKSIQAMFHRR